MVVLLMLATHTVVVGISESALQTQMEPLCALQPPLRCRVALHTKLLFGFDPLVPVRARPLFLLTVLLQLVATVCQTVGQPSKGITRRIQLTLRRRLLLLLAALKSLKVHQIGRD